MTRLCLAPGVEFFENEHEYWYKGRRLSGITGIISKRLGMKMPESIMSEHQAEGIHVHKAIQKWIETGAVESVHPGVRWAAERLYERRERLDAEVLVSDLKQYASAVDIIESGDGLVLYDIKKGAFKRDYCTWQLSVYKYFVELTGKAVKDCVVICLRDQEFYKIFPKPAEEVEELLYG